MKLRFPWHKPGGDYPKLPFQDVTGVTSLLLEPQNFYTLVASLERGIERNLEDGLIITVKREGDIARVVGLYDIPDEYKMTDSVKFTEVFNSRWFKHEMMPYISKKHQKIGFYYHTHPCLEKKDSIEHEMDEYDKLVRLRGSEFFSEKNMLSLGEDAISFSIMSNLFRTGSIFAEYFGDYSLNLFGLVPSECMARTHYPGNDNIYFSISPLVISVPKIDVSFSLSNIGQINRSRPIHDYKHV